jgi:prefoldin subunit 5
MEQVQKAIAQLRHDINRLKDGIVSVEKLIAEKEQTIEEMTKLLTLGDTNEQK